MPNFPAWAADIAEAAVLAPRVYSKFNDRFAFIGLKSSEERSNLRDALLINAGDKAGWYQHVHRRVEPVNEIGLYTVDDVTISGHCYVERRGKLVVDTSHFGNLSIEFAKREELPFEEFVAAKRKIDVSRPVLNIAGPGYPIWGHWLIDFLPRLAIAQKILGCALEHAVIPLPTDTPKWVFEFAQFFTGIGMEYFVLYDKDSEAVASRRGYVPTFAHNVGLHTFLLELYCPFIRTTRLNELKKICVSREGMAGRSRSVHRIFKQQQYFESVAQRRGYELVCPERLTFRQQLDLFGAGGVVVGEYGSGMHNAIFSPRGTIVGQVCIPNSYQNRIAALCEHRSIFLLPDEEYTESGVNHIGVDERQIDLFFDAIESLDLTGRAID